MPGVIQQKCFDFRELYDEKLFVTKCIDFPFDLIMNLS